MKTKPFKPILSVWLLAALLLTSLSVFPASANMNSASDPDNREDAIIKEKREAIYATLASDGKVNAIYVVNHFKVTGAGNVKDYGDYSSVKNLTNIEPLTQNGDSVSFHADEGNFYYQGNMTTTELPWKFDIFYYLDGAKIVPQNLAGKSGELKIHMVTKKNEKVNPIFSENYMLQISMTLDTEKCANIIAPGGMIAFSGKNTIVTYMVMPGKDGDISLFSTVQDFAMDGIQISAMPLKLGIEMPDTGEMTDKMITLSDAISDFNDGVKKLNDGFADMSEGAKKLAKGSKEFDNGLSRLSDSSEQLTQASGQIDSALSKIVASLDNSSGGIDFSAIAQLPEGLAQLSQALSGISEGLTQLKGGLLNANNALDSAVASLPDISQIAIESLSSAPSIAGLDENQRRTFNQLLQAYTTAQTVKGVYYGLHGDNGIKAAFDSAIASLDTMSGSVDAISQNLSKISTEIKNPNITIFEQMQQLVYGLTALSNNYRQFNSGLIEYTSGVKELSSNYGRLHIGLVQLSDGTVDLHEGTKELYLGTSELNDNVADLPETMQAEIDNLMKDYDKSDFKPVSFVSAKNSNVSLVQFVFKTAGIIELKQETVMPEIELKETVFVRFLALLTALFR